MALTAAERADLTASDEGAAKLVLLDALTDTQLEEMLGSGLLDIDGNPATTQEKNRFRRKFLNRLERFNTSEKARARINIIGTSGKTVNFQAWEDYSGFEKNLIRNRAKKLESQGQGLQIPRDVIQALDTTDMDAAISALVPVSTNKMRRDLIKSIAAY